MTNNSEEYEPLNEADEEERERNNEQAEEDFRDGLREAGFTDEDIERQLRDLKK